VATAARLKRNDGRADGGGEVEKGESGGAEGGSRERGPQVYIIGVDKKTGSGQSGGVKATRAERPPGRAGGPPNGGLVEEPRPDSTQRAAQWEKFKLETKKPWSQWPSDPSGQPPRGESNPVKPGQTSLADMKPSPWPGRLRPATQANRSKSMAYTINTQHKHGQRRAASNRMSQGESNPVKPVFTTGQVVKSGREMRLATGNANF
jgi:hypothetical protein